MRKASLFCKVHALGYIPFIVLLKCGNYIKFLSHSLQNKITRRTLMNRNLMCPPLRLASSQSVPRWWRVRGNIWMHDWRVTAQEKSCNGSVHPHPIPLPHKNPSTLFSLELLGLQLSKYATVVNSLLVRCLCLLQAKAQAVKMNRRW